MHFTRWPALQPCRQLRRSARGRGFLLAPVPLAWPMSTIRHNRRGTAMPKRDFNDHCWKDIVDQETLDIYASYRRELFVGRNPAVLAIDLYKKAYQGGSRPVAEVNRSFDGSCGENAWK